MRGPVRTLFAAAVLMALVGCSRPPVQTKLSAVLTQQYVGQFKALGVTEIRIDEDDGLPMAAFRGAQNGRVTVRGRTLPFEFPRGIGGLMFPFDARLIDTDHGPAIAVSAEVDQREASFVDAVGSISMGLNVGLSTAGPGDRRNRNEASWK